MPKENLWKMIKSDPSAFAQNANAPVPSRPPRKAKSGDYIGSKSNSSYKSMKK